MISESCWWLEGGIMHSQNVLPSDSSAGLKHGREERDENLYIKTDIIGV